MTKVCLGYPGDITCWLQHYTLLTCSLPVAFGLTVMFTRYETEENDLEMTFHFCLSGGYNYLTCSFPPCFSFFFRKSSTASTACWKRLPLLILIISSLWGWYGFSCSTFIQALHTHNWINDGSKLDMDISDKWCSRFVYLLVFSSKEFDKMAFFPSWLFQVLWRTDDLERQRKLITIALTCS